MTVETPAAVFAPVRSQTAFEETVDRLGTAIRIGLLAPGSRLPAERELCTMLGIARSTLRQALTALTQSGHVHALRGRSGGTFVALEPPPAPPPSPALLAGWRETCDARLAVEVGVAVLAAQRSADVTALRAIAAELETLRDDFPAYRQADVRLHVALAEATGSERLVASMTEAQGAVSELISHIAHPVEVLTSSDRQHHRLLHAVERSDVAHAAQVMTEHVQATEHVLAGLMPG